MVEKIKMDVDRLLFVLSEKKFPINFATLELFFNFETKCSLLYVRSFLSSSLFSKFWKENCMYFKHKHVETWNQ